MSERLEDAAPTAIPGGAAPSEILAPPPSAVSAFAPASEAGSVVSMSNRPKPATLKDVARRAGVHFTTVSLALRGHPRIPLTTRERLVRLASEMGYTRDPVLMALTERRLRARASGRRPFVALLSNHPTRESFDSTEHMRFFLAGAREQAEASGYECELVLAAGSNPNGAALIRELTRRDCVGVIFAALNPDYPLVRGDWSAFSTAKIDARHTEPDVPFVSNDQLQVVRLACDRAAELGYRRPGLEIGVIDEQGTQHRFTSGWLLAQRNRETEARVPIFKHELAEKAESTAQRLGEWVRTNQVDVVLGNSPFTLELLRMAGLRVPREVGFICLCRPSAEVRIAGVAQDHRLVGAKAMELVAMGLRIGARGAAALRSDSYVAGRWHDGATAPGRP